MQRHMYAGRCWWPTPHALEQASAIAVAGRACVCCGFPPQALRASYSKGTALKREDIYIYNLQEQPSGSETRMSVGDVQLHILWEDNSEVHSTWFPKGPLSKSESSCLNY